MSSTISATRPSTSNRDEVVLFPAIARRDPAGAGWRTLVRGCVIRPRPDGLRRRLLFQFFRRAFRISASESESPIFQERIAEFLHLPRLGASVDLSAANAYWGRKRTSRLSGHFKSVIRLDDGALSPWQISTDHPTWIRFSAAIANSIDPPSEGQACFIPDLGISVISDIDDTIKLTEVDNRRRLMSNTFLSPFHAIPGMSELYQQWRTAGVAFHYVSSSPWQLYVPLMEFLQREQFPMGSIHLRTLRLRDPSILQLLVGKKQSKVLAMNGLLKWYPRRRFVLIGDAGEKDPELYGAIARRYPTQVAACFIRVLPGRSISHTRLRQAFNDVDRQRWHLYHSVEELQELARTWM